jgi:hypothetical protein
MTPNQIKRKLSAAGFDLSAIVEISRDQICIGYPSSAGIVELDDRERTEAAVDQAAAILQWGGFYAQWGGCYLRAGYVANDYGYCDKSNPCHY